MSALYADRDHEAQGAHYLRHIEAMTAEGLHAKSDIAGELAARDMAIQQLRNEVDELDALRDKLAGLLSRTAVALRGPEPPLTRWSWHDLPERAAAAIAAIDVMQRAAVMAAKHDDYQGTRNAQMHD